MVYNLLEEYKKIFNFRKCFLKHYRKLYIAIIVILTIICFIGIVEIIKLHFLTLFILIPIIFIVLIGAIVFLSIKEISRILKNVYNMESLKEYNEQRRSDFLEKVKMNKIDIRNKEQMEMLLELIDKEIKKLKPKEFVNNGIKALIFGPLWITYISCLFKYGCTNLKDATILFLVVFVVIDVVLAIINNFKSDIYYGILNTNLENIKYMDSLLRDAYLISLNIAENDIV